MDSKFGPLITTVTVFPLVALSAALPYVAFQYRRRGTVGAGHLLLAGVFGLYLVGLAFYVILPLRPVTPDFCDVYGVDAYVSPLQTLREIHIETPAWSGRTLLDSGTVQALVLNVLLFVPLGMFVRHLLRRGFLMTVAIGIGVSVLIELTQLTGDWYLYPCPYRYFDTVDVVANTIGATMGAIAAPFLRLVPAQRAPAEPGSAQTVTPARRLLAAACNAAAVLLLGIVLLAVAGLVLKATRGDLFASGSVRARVLRALALVWVPGTALLLAGPLAWRGQTPGDWAVLIRPRAPGHSSLPARAILARFIVGPAPLLALAGVGLLGVYEAWFALLVLAAAQGFFVDGTPITDDGAARMRIGVKLTDARAGPGPAPEPWPESEPPSEPEPGP